MKLFVLPFLSVLSPTLLFHSREVQQRPYFRPVLLHELCPLLACTHTRRAINDTSYVQTHAQTYVVRPDCPSVAFNSTL